MNVLFEDKDIIVCLKERGLLSQAESSGGKSMVTELSEFCGSDIFPLHRLDKEVGGVMIYAKNKTAAAILSRDIAERKFIKEYIALVYGKPEKEKGEMQDLLFKDSRKNKSFVVKRERKGVKKASLEYEVLKNNDEKSMVLIRLHTGRTHQIRVQFASRKMPLVGDKKYGARDDSKIMGLWCYKISFNHPKTGEEMTFLKEPDFDL